MSLKKDFEQVENQKCDIIQYENGLQSIICKKCELTEENLKIKENSIINLGKFYESQNQSQKIYDLVVSIKTTLNDFPKAKAAKIFKILIELNERNIQTRDLSIKLCEYLIEWCIEEKRTYLKHRIQIKLSNLLWHQEKYQIALDITTKILDEVRKADDKHLLVEIELVQAKIYHSLESFAKAKASLTAARSCANSIYCPVALQADIDLMSGILQAEDQDYKTAFSYFYESFEAFHQQNIIESALKSLKLVILCKIMMNQLDDVNSLLNGKYGLKYAGASLDALREIADAHGKRKLQEFSQVLIKYENEITKDRLIKNYINTLYENLMEKNLMSIIKPYSHVQIDHISKQINLSVNEIQNKLSEMILDKKIDGTLDQENNCLIIFDNCQNDKLYDNAMNCIENTSIVIDRLFEKYRKVKAM